jgi:hypothetical protein
MRIPRGVSRFSRIMGAGALLAGALGLWSTQPAFAAINVCGDSTIAQPTAVHQLPSASSPTVQFLNRGAVVNEGYCEYFNNVSEGHWYMAVRTMNGSNGGVGFIWIQRLYWGSRHLCATIGDPYDLHVIGGSDGVCPLIQYG